MAEKKKELGPKHDFEFESEFDDKTSKTTLTIKDAISGKKWQKVLNAASSFPKSDYDKMVQIFNDESVDFNCYVIDSNQHVMVCFAKDDVNYQWEMEECD